MAIALIVGATGEVGGQLLEQALGETTGKQKKEEYYRQVRRQQRVGR